MTIIKSFGKHLVEANEINILSFVQTVLVAVRVRGPAGAPSPVGGASVCATSTAG